MHRIVSLLPAATEIAGALGLMDEVVGVSHECDFPDEANQRRRAPGVPSGSQASCLTRLPGCQPGDFLSGGQDARQPSPAGSRTSNLPRVTRCPVHNARLTSREVDEWVRRALRDNGTIYTIDEALLRKLRPDVILTQKLCDVCAVGYGTVAKLAQTLPGPPKLINLEPSSLSDIFDDIRRVGEICGVPERADKVIAELSDRIEVVRRRADRIVQRPRCFVMEWVDPPFCSGHWVPELVEIAGGCDPLGRKHQPSVQIEWQEVVAARPDVIILALCGYDIDRARRDYELLRSFPKFDSIPAARRGEIYLVDASAYFARPGPRIVDSLEILAGILHPREFPEFASRGPEDLRSVRVA